MKISLTNDLFSIGDKHLRTQKRILETIRLKRLSNRKKSVFLTNTDTSFLFYFERAKQKYYNNKDNKNAMQ